MIENKYLIKDAILLNSINTLIKNNNFKNHDIDVLNDYCKELVLNSMYPVIYTNDELISQAHFLKMTSDGKNICVIRSTYKILDNEYNINGPFTSYKKIMIEVLNSLDNTFEKCLYEHAPLFNECDINDVLSNIIKASKQIAIDSHRGLGNKILIAKNVYSKIKANIIPSEEDRYMYKNIDKEPPYLNDGRDIEFIGTIDDIKVYLNKTSKSTNNPIFIWYSGESPIDNPFIYYTNIEGIINNSKNILSKSNFVDANVGNNYINISNYMSRIDIKI